MLRQQVLRNTFADGSLPDEVALGAEFGVSRNTIRESLALLAEEGLVNRVPGVGTVVCGAKFPHSLTRLMGLAETLHEHQPVRNQVRIAGLVDPPREVARRLRVPDGDQVVYIERVRWAGELPLSFDLTYLVAGLGARLLDEDLGNEDIFGLLEKVSGRSLGRAEVNLEAINADPHAAAILSAPRGSALLVLERLTHLDDGRPVDLEYVRFRGDRLSMRAVLERESGERAG